MATRAVTALFDDYEAAARAVDKLEAEGIPHGAISIVASDPDNRIGGRAPAARSPPRNRTRPTAPARVRRSARCWAAERACSQDSACSPSRASARSLRRAGSSPR
ncbi:hypothetical protein ACFQFE_03700 [Methylobacterium gregans]